MKLKLFLMTMAAAAMVFAACSKDLYNEGSDTPPHAASTKTWVFGDQVWSDAIRIPECNKTSFEDSYTDPQCRSHTYRSKTWYYYNWPYVNAHGEQLCPSPWRVPTHEDFIDLSDVVFGTDSLDSWRGGLVDDQQIIDIGYEDDIICWLWSAEAGCAPPESSSDACGPVFFYSNHGSEGYDIDIKPCDGPNLGMQVRCVKWTESY